MKEYLLQRNGKYELHQGGIVPDGAIEVPEGADFYAEDGNLGIRKNYFFRLRSDSFYDDAIWLDNQWMKAQFNVSCMEVKWQRPTQPEELPFVSLNDQYAEIEKVRQSEWSKQVGGNHYKSMKIQPAQFALENKLDYCQANAIKYICRHEYKNGKEDLEKAKHYIDLLIEHHYG